MKTYVKATENNLQWHYSLETFKTYKSRIQYFALAPIVKEILIFVIFDFEKVS